MRYLAVGSKKFSSGNHIITMKVADMDTKNIIVDVSSSGPSQTETYDFVKQQLLNDLTNSNILDVKVPNLEKLITLI